MKKVFQIPDLEVVHFTSDDIVTTSCCDVGGLPFDDDDTVCPSGDSECTCGSDLEQNCKT